MDKNPLKEATNFRIKSTFSYFVYGFKICHDLIHVLSLPVMWYSGICSLHLQETIKFIQLVYSVDLQYADEI